MISPWSRQRARKPPGVTVTASRLPQSTQKRGGSRSRVQPPHVGEPQAVQRRVWWAARSEVASIGTGSEDAGEGTDRHPKIGQHLKVLIG